MGGCDLIFPHHQNEIAQTEAVTGKQFAKYWFHAGHLLVDNKKMAKSANNFYTLEDLEKQSKNPARMYRAFRMMNLQNNYRQSFNFTFDRLDAAQNTVDRFDAFFRRLAHYHGPDASIRREFSA